jgi:tetratricopeptide (TPR) repeat protein
MRRIGLVVIFLAAAAWPAAAQMDKQIAVPAGSPEDKALAAIDAASDPHQKLALIDKFAAEHPQGDFALAADELYVSSYLTLKEYPKVFEYGDKALAINPDDLAVAIQVINAAQFQNDSDKVVAYGQKVVQMVDRCKNAPAPAGTTGQEWASQIQQNLDRVQTQLQWVGEALYQAGVSLANSRKVPQARTALNEAVAVDPGRQAAVATALKKLGSAQ